MRLPFSILVSCLLATICCLPISALTTFTRASAPVSVSMRMVLPLFMTGCMLCGTLIRIHISKVRRNAAYDQQAGGPLWLKGCEEAAAAQTDVRIGFCCFRSIMSQVLLPVHWSRAQCMLRELPASSRPSSKHHVCHLFDDLPAAAKAVQQHWPLVGPHDLEPSDAHPTPICRPHQLLRLLLDWASWHLNCPILSPRAVPHLLQSRCMAPPGRATTTGLSRDWMISCLLLRYDPCLVC